MCLNEIFKDSALISAIIGGLIAGLFSLAAILIAHWLERRSLLQDEIDKLQDRLRVFLLELKQNKEIAEQKAQALEHVLSHSSQIIDFDNPHSSREAFKAVKAELAFGYRDLFAKIQAVYDELARLDKWIDKFDEKYPSKEWSDIGHGLPNLISFIRRAIPRYRQQAAVIEEIISELSKK